MIGRLFHWTSILIFLAVLAIPVAPAAQDKQDSKVAPAAQQSKQESAKTEGQPWKLSVGANLVIVPVVVTDKHGEHVSGLKAEDFEVKEEGAVQKIVNVDEITAESTKVERAAPPEGRAFSNMVAQRPKRLV